MSYRRRTLPKMPGAVAVLAAALLLAACDLPRDPRDTTETVAGETLRVGWIAGTAPGPEERAAIARLAAALGARIEPVEGPLHRLAAELRAGRLHVVGGDLPKETPFSRRVGLSKAVGTIVPDGERQETVFAIRPGENRFLMHLNRAISAARRAP